MDWFMARHFPLAAFDAIVLTGFPPAGFHGVSANVAFRFAAEQLTYMSCRIWTACADIFQRTVRE